MYNIKELGKEAIEVFGEDYQLLKATEECIELAQALIHYRIGTATKEEVITEIADVKIILSQLYLIFEENNNINNEIESF